MNESPASSPFILAGMHRSGTSLAASLLQAAGISMGEHFFPPGVGNVKGHFEDRDFLDLHIAILKHHQLDWVGWTTQSPIPVPPQLIEQAQQLLTKKSAAHPDSLWGWKDPRTTLFLDFWQYLLPNARFIFMYRAPWEVFDSLARRGTDIDLLKSPARILELWSFYNRQVLHFMSQHPSQCLLISNDALAANPSSLLHAINNQFHLALPTTDSHLFDPALMRRESALSWHAAAVNDYDPALLALFQQLNEQSPLPAQSLAPSISSEDKRTLAGSLLTEWLAHRAADIQRQQLQSDREHYEQHAHHVEELLSNQRTHSANLEQSLAKHQQHIANLEQALITQQKHASNLEQLLTTQQTHSANLEQALATQQAHIANLEKMLSALKIHAANLEKLVNYQPNT